MSVAEVLYSRTREIQMNLVKASYKFLPDDGEFCHYRVLSIRVSDKNVFLGTTISLGLKLRIDKVGGIK